MTAGETNGLKFFALLFPGSNKFSPAARLAGSHIVGNRKRKRGTKRKSIGNVKKN